MKELKGLIQKDWMLMSRQLKVMVVYILVFTGIFSFTLSKSGALSGFFSTLMFLLAINCFAYDEQVNFEKLVASSPVPRSKVVLARYIATLSLGAVGGMVINMVNFFILTVRQSDEASLTDTLLQFVAALGIAVLLVSILFPVFYKFGVNKSRLILLLVCGIPALAVLLLSTVLPGGTWESIASDERLEAILPVGIPLFLIAALAVSLLLSTRILQKKEY